VQEQKPNRTKSQNHKAGADARKQRRLISLMAYFYHPQVSLRRHGAHLSSLQTRNPDQTFHVDGRAVRFSVVRSRLRAAFLVANSLSDAAFFIYLG
jgi:hypothetical protein